MMAPSACGSCRARGTSIAAPPPPAAAPPAPPGRRKAPPATGRKAVLEATGAAARAAVAAAVTVGFMKASPLLQRTVNAGGGGAGWSGGIEEAAHSTQRAPIRECHVELSARAATSKRSLPYLKSAASMGSCTSTCEEKGEGFDQV